MVKFIIYGPLALYCANFKAIAFMTPEEQLLERSISVMGFTTFTSFHDPGLEVKVQFHAARARLDVQVVHVVLWHPVL